VTLGREDGSGASPDTTVANDNKPHDLCYATA
jgi:hypothetical protein